MTRNEWIAALKKAKDLAEGENEMCYKMFGYLHDAINSLPVRYYRDEMSEEEDEFEE